MPRFGLIGYPVSHSKSPELFRAACGGRFDYDLIETPDFDEAISIFSSGDYLAINVTAPFKTAAAAYASVCTREALATSAANILVKTKEGVKACNSDVYAVLKILGNIPATGKVLVIGLGGAGRAALYAARELGLDCEVCNRTVSNNRCGFPHPVHPLSEMAVLAERSDFIIYTLPCPVDGISAFEGKTILEANYLDPSLEPLAGRYISGQEWLRLQAEEGFRIMLSHLNK